MWHQVLAFIQSDRLFFKRIASVMGIVLAAFVTYRLKSLLSSFLIALVIAYAFDPVVDWFESKKFSRAGAILILALLFFLALTLFFLLVFPLLVSQGKDIISTLPEKFTVAHTWLNQFLSTRFNIQTPDNFRDFFVKISEQSDLKEKLVQIGSDLAKKSISSLLGLVLGFLSLLLIPVLAVFLLLDFDILIAKITPLIPHAIQRNVETYLSAANSIFSRFFRGQVLLIFIITVLYAIGFWVSGVPYALILAGIFGLGQLIPYLGPLVGLSLGLICILTEFHGFGPIIGFGVCYLIIQGLEGWVLTPRIVGKSTGLSVLASVLSLLVFGELFGLIGLIFAIPLGALTQTLLKQGLK